MKKETKVVKKPAAKSVTPKTAGKKGEPKQAKSLKLTKKIATAEGLERIRTKKTKK